MAPYYKLLTGENDPILPLDKALLEKMEERNKAELAAFDEKLKEAEKTEGETEIADILRGRAMYLTKIGDKVRRILALAVSKGDTTSRKPPSLPSKQP
jgi:26S proteasome regulatory subunit N7